MSKGRLAKELQRCLKNLHGFTDGQVQMIDCDWDSLSFVKFEIAPNEGIYKGGRYTFNVKFPPIYPNYKPKVTCLTNIFHPNIVATEHGGDVCLSLFDDWTASNTLEDVIHGMLFLLYNPNLDDPLSEVTVNDVEKFEKVQTAIVTGKTAELADSDDYDFVDLSDDFFNGAKEDYDRLCPEEWDVLTEAAKVAWSYQLEQDKWQEEMKIFEEEQKQERLHKFEQNISDLNSKSPSPIGRQDYAFGKSALQRFSTVTAPVGQANILSFNAPEQGTVKSWGQQFSAVDINSPITEEQEEDMDCIPAPSSENASNVPVASVFEPFGSTSNLFKPSLTRTFTC